MQKIRTALISLGFVKQDYRELLGSYKPQEKLIDFSNPNIKLYYNTEKLTGTKHA
jgi:hypothetical protein